MIGRHIQMMFAGRTTFEPKMYCMVLQKGQKCVCGVPVSKCTDEPLFLCDRSVNYWCTAKYREKLAVHRQIHSEPFRAP